MKENNNNNKKKNRLHVSHRQGLFSLISVKSMLTWLLLEPSKSRAYMMLRINNDGSDYGSWEAGRYLHDDDDDFGDPHDLMILMAMMMMRMRGNVMELMPVIMWMRLICMLMLRMWKRIITLVLNSTRLFFPSDEAYARALQDAEEREMAARLLALAGISNREIVFLEDHGVNSQETLEEVDPGELSYVEIPALGQAVGADG